MTPVSYYTHGEITSPKFAYAFAKGCKGTITKERHLFPGSVALFGSPPQWPILRQAQSEGREWYYADHGYFHRQRYFRVTKNSYQHDGRGEYSMDRLRQFVAEVQPWRTSGRHILVCPHSDVFFQLHGLDAETWRIGVVRSLREHTDRAIRVRWKWSRVPLRVDLQNAWALVTFSSMAAVEALIAGVPIITLAPWASTVRMGQTNVSEIEHPFYPDDRDQFLAALASNQWTLTEMAQGVAWKALNEQEQDRAA